MLKTSYLSLEKKNQGVARGRVWSLCKGPALKTSSPAKWPSQRASAACGLEMSASVRETRNHRGVNEGVTATAMQRKEMECSDELPPVEGMGRKGQCDRGS